MEEETKVDEETLNPQEQEVLETSEDIEALRAELEKAKEVANNYKIRAEKAERMAKEKPEPKTQDSQKNINNTLSREEAILIAKGFSEEALEKLQQVAKATGKSLLDSQQDDLFTAWQEKKEAENKAEQARLGASKGSATVTGKANFATPGLSATEHKKLWKETMSK